MNKSDMYNTFPDVYFRFEPGRNYCHDNYSSIHWSFGDTVDIDFDLDAKHPFPPFPPFHCDCDEDQEEEQEDSYVEYLEYKKVVIDFFNHRMEKIWEQTFNSSDDEIDKEHRKVIVRIDSETSSEVFKKGVYYCSVKIMDEDEDEGGEIWTIVNQNECIINVV